MRNFALIMILLLAGCTVKEENKSGGSAAPSDSINIRKNEIYNAVDSVEAMGTDEGLNNIRFENFTDVDWVDNEYIKAYRKHLDDYNAGRIDDESLDKYKDMIRGKFVIGYSSPYILGGLFLQVIFIDYPEYLFNAWIYSDVDAETRTVSNYDVRSTQLDEENTNLTKEQIMEEMKNHPEFKLW